MTPHVHKTKDYFCIFFSIGNNTSVSTDTDCIPVLQIEFVSHTNFSTKKLKT